MRSSSAANPVAASRQFLDPISPCPARRAGAFSCPDGKARRQHRKRSFPISAPRLARDDAVDLLAIATGERVQQRDGALLLRRIQTGKNVSRELRCLFDLRWHLLLAANTHPDVAIAGENVQTAGFAVS